MYTRTYSWKEQPSGGNMHYTHGHYGAVINWKGLHDNSKV